jgi:hypothetical protein
MSDRQSAIEVTVITKEGLSFPKDKEAEENLTGEELEKIVNADLDGFSEFFCKRLNNDSLSGPERAVIKTYLWWKTHPEGTSG